VSRSTRSAAVIDLAAAAAVVTLFALASNERRHLWSDAPADPARGVLVSELTDELGDDVAALALAARVADTDSLAEAPVE